MVLGAFAALAQADMSAYKMSMFKAKGVNVERIERMASHHRTKSAPYLANHRAQSAYIKEGKTTPEQDAARSESRVDYYEALLIGLIDGFTSTFNEDCRSGLAETVRNGFSVLSTYQVWIPANTAKFPIA